MPVFADTIFDDEDWTPGPLLCEECATPLLDYDEWDLRLCIRCQQLTDLGGEA